MQQSKQIHEETRHNQSTDKQSADKQSAVVQSKPDESSTEGLSKSNLNNVEDLLKAADESKVDKSAKTVEEELESSWMIRSRSMQSRWSSMLQSKISTAMFNYMKKQLAKIWQEVTESKQMHNSDNKQRVKTEAELKDDLKSSIE